MICEYCHKGNRSIAKFCKWCGKPISNQNLLEKMVGQAEVKAQLKSIVDTYTYLRSRKDISVVRLSINVVIIGETGTGKTSLAEIIRDYFYQQRIIAKPKLTMVDAVTTSVSLRIGTITSRKLMTAFCFSTMYRSCCLTSTRIR